MIGRASRAGQPAHALSIAAFFMGAAGPVGGVRKNTHSWRPGFSSTGAACKDGISTLIPGRPAGGGVTLRRRRRAPK